jgi:ubiquinone/menaquinone biosynthesis C-methylase UbiE
MGFYRTCIVPALIECAMRGRHLQPCRERVVAEAEGRVLEIGAGSGLNFARYPQSVDAVVAVEPSAQMLRRAIPRAVSSLGSICMVEGSAERLPLPDGSFDTVVSTWTMCSIPEIGRALAELRRVLRPGGALLFIEHGLAAEPGVRRWQQRLDPMWCRIAGGCHLDRPIDRLISEAGFRLDRLRTFRLPGPRTHTFMYEGRAS